MILQERFYLLLKNLNFSEVERVSLWNDLSNFYSQKFRKYHNLDHLQQMFLQYELHLHKLQNPVEVAVAIFYHDIIYKVTANDNEEKSAEYARSIFKNCVVDNNIIENLILATKNHEARTNDEKWMVDFDLSVLGQEWELYCDYSKKIRKEYRIYPSLIYNPGRRKVLIHFLEKEQIFQTEFYFHKYEAIARANLQKELNSL
ncbi:HD domain-containing protein [Frigoriflavimonas asaccharolytica]|uniref:Putative metal-dependent HD superfamily phosphohydrolase n=1 Tax=Frigoriflavimonas asaccharolytica TaxID=2735899 RepID=A0A8J8GAW6_9FLAO|nr:hypothetical protein [Frigoriflavimonas asaccharolytica]NRS92590.1 putative metal-dependent HD superfamily phosphohydrolase [Frigoriflavimonas asaccharolytica]